MLVNRSFNDANYNCIVVSSFSLFLLCIYFGYHSFQYSFTYVVDIDIQINHLIQKMNITSIGGLKLLKVINCILDTYIHSNIMVTTYDQS